MKKSILTLLITLLPFMALGNQEINTDNSHCDFVYDASNNDNGVRVGACGGLVNLNNGSASGIIIIRVKQSIFEGGNEGIGGKNLYLKGVDANSYKYPDSKYSKALNNQCTLIKDGVTYKTNDWNLAIEWFNADSATLTADLQYFLICRNANTQ